VRIERRGRSRTARSNVGAVLGAGALIVMAFAAPAAAQWRFVPEVRLTGGEESDLVVDPGVNRVVVPGGPFAEITPILALRWFGRTARAEMGTYATVQQFMNDDNRLLYAQTAWGDLHKDLGKSFRCRLSAVAEYFDDSERETVRRYGGGGDAGITFLRPRWNAEIWTGASGREYPNLTVDSDGAEMMSTTYAEATWSGGATLRVSPAERLAVRGDGLIQATDSRDPSYDSRSWAVSGSVDARLVSSAFLTLSGTYQQRNFTSRPEAADDDAYWLVGAGLRYVVAAAWTASIRYGYSMYTWPEGYDEDSHRLAVAIQYTWGRPNVPTVPPVDIGTLTRDSGGSFQKPDAAGNVRLRIHAPNAAAVSVAGDFNAWNSQTTPLRAAGEGWWEVELRLAPGNYEYVYVIDGSWTTPPEAKITREDGFGGRNGVLEILPPDA